MFFLLLGKNYVKNRENRRNVIKNKYFSKISFLAVHLQPLLIPRIDKSRF